MQSTAGTAYLFLLQGKQGTRYVIQSTTNLNNPAAWVPVLDLTLINSTRVFPWTNRSERGRFFRAIRP